MAKEYTYRGKTVEELKKMSLDEFAKLVPSRERRKIKRGLTDIEKNLLESVKANENNINTHARDMIILPEMIGKSIKIHNGKEWVEITVLPEMLGHRLGEFSMTRKSVRHSSPGIGATRSSASLSVK